LSLKIERVWKRVGVTLFLIGFGGWVWSAALTFHYQAILPRRPDPTAGNVYPLNVHGIVVYQTRDQRSLLDEMEYSSIAVVAVSALMAAIHQKKWGKPPAPPWELKRS
jgi:hypothetical protein